jgi:cobalamin biosynthesis protein CobT
MTADGRRCKAARLSGRSVFCTAHSQQEQQYIDSKKVAAELLGPLDEFRTSLAVNQALGKLFSLTAKNRIPVRNAAVLAYIAQLLLSTMRDVRREIAYVDGAAGEDYLIRRALNSLDVPNPQNENDQEDEEEEEEEKEEIEEEKEVKKEEQEEVKAEPKKEDEKEDKKEDKKEEATVVNQQPAKPTRQEYPPGTRLDLNPHPHITYVPARPKGEF